MQKSASRSSLASLESRSLAFSLIKNAASLLLTTSKIRLRSCRINSSFSGFRCEVLGGDDSGQYKSVKRESGLGRKSEQFADEVSLADHISIGQPSHSALPDHVHGLDALQRPPRTLKRSIALGHPNSLLNRPVVLFNHVIEVLALA